MSLFLSDCLVSSGDLCAWICSGAPWANKLYPQATEKVKSAVTFAGLSYFSIVSCARDNRNRILLTSGIDLLCARTNSTWMKKNRTKFSDLNLGVSVCTHKPQLNVKNKTEFSKSLYISIKNDFISYYKFIMILCVHYINKLFNISNSLWYDL